MANRKFTAYEICNMTESAVWDLPKGGVTITFDDKSKFHYKTESTIVTWYLWQQFRKFPGAPILPQHHLANENDPVTPGEAPRKVHSHYRKSSHAAVGQDIFWHIFFKGDGPKTRERVVEQSKHWYEITNMVYNAASRRLREFVRTISAHDLYAILNHDFIKETLSLFREKKIKIDEAYDRNYNFIMDPPPELYFNEVCRAARAGLLDHRQITQMLGQLGLVRDMDGQAFGKPIDVGYGHGLHDQGAQMVESRKASIAHIMTTAPLETAEYNTRQCQLAQVVRGITKGDCGTTDVLNWTVREQDLKVIRGKLYYAETGQLEYLTGYETHLIGKTIKIRHIAGCKHAHEGVPCETCVGFTALVTPPGSSYGLFNCTMFLEKLAQSILSTKHVIVSAKFTYLNLDAEGRRLLALNPDQKQDIHLAAGLDPDEWCLRFALEDAMFINDIKDVESIDDLTPARVTELKFIEFVRYGSDGNVKEIYNIDTTIGGGGTPLSRELLFHMVETGWDVVGDKLEVPLENFEPGGKIMESLRRGEDIMSIVQDFSAFIHSPKKTTRSRLIDQPTHLQALQTFIDVIGGRIGVNLSQMECFTMSLASKVHRFGPNATEYEKTKEGSPTYALPAPGDEFMYLTIAERIMNGAPGAALAYEHHRTLIHDTASYSKTPSVAPYHSLNARWTEVDNTKG